MDGPAFHRGAAIRLRFALGAASLVKEQMQHRYVLDCDRTIMEQVVELACFWGKFIGYALF